MFDPEGVNQVRDAGELIRAVRQRERKGPFPLSAGFHLPLSMRRLLGFAVFLALVTCASTKDEPQAFAGRFFKWGPLECHPKPVQKPGVPIVVGGHTELAARRAARYGDGFFPGVADDEKLGWLLGIMRDECKKLGRDPKTIEVTSGRAAPDVDGVRRLADMGVSRFMVPPGAFDPEGVTRGLEELGKLIVRCR